MPISDTIETRELQKLIRRSEELRNVFAETTAPVNARTCSVHDATDLKLLLVGMYELTGMLPLLNPYQVRI